MFIVILTYKVPLETVDQHLPEHLDFLKRHYELGTFLASGPREPRSGGILLAQAASREALLEQLALDPFSRHNLADYEIIEFIPRMTCPELAFLNAS
ncbi:MAG: GTP cyclohydrolase [Proteobacteria bacterium]|nr:GTP cyclohydrolase [Pseudomonadota bacterium]